MSIYVYTTDKCKKDSIEHAIVKEIKQFKKRILQTQRTTFLDNFPPPYLKKRFKRQQRLIACEKTIGDDIIIIFCCILVRGGNEYSNFLASPKEYGDEHFSTLVSDEDLTKWLAEMKKTDPAPEKKKLSEKEFEFLYHQVGKTDGFVGDYFIYETYDWTKSVRKSDIDRRLIIIPEKVLDLLEEEGNDKTEVKFCTLDGAYKIMYKIYPYDKILLLIDIGEVGTLKEGSWEERLSDNDIDTVNRISAKCYPALILADNDTWINIQNSKEANLALSPEETKLLKSIHKGEITEDQRENNKEQTIGFPLFINGRAGSGKSTILQYLFSDYLKSYFEIKCDDAFSPPIYLTYSDTLVEKSKQVVKSLLKYDYAKSSDTFYNEDTVNQSIQVFKIFLLNGLPNNLREKFSEKYFINYSKFKEKWQKQFQNDPKALKDYNPDISWHCIRSYIKGLSIDGYLEMDEYNELSKEDKSISLETFKLVYEKVWNSWYKGLCEGEWWDEQDLVREWLNQDNIPNKYPAIFCDEAQDFTKIELELLLRLNMFTERKIDSTTLRKIPFAFAGDPFQTLNPTGFRWESVKSTYVEKFIHSLTPELRFGKPELNYQELTFNYRSSENIVKLCNTIQLLRMILFKYSNSKPQESWHIEESSSLPTFFKIDSAGIQDDIREQEDLCIIVPCSQGEEAEFVKNDEFLNEVVERDDAGVPQNVFSSMRAKGLEFPRILVYGFGKHNPDILNFDKYSMQDQIDIDDDSKITLEYFVNQLYVALSRGQKRVFIVDSSESFENLWKFASNEGFQEEELLSRVKSKKNWESAIGNIMQGDRQSWSKDKENSSTRAKQYDDEGRINRDSYLLRQAAMAWKSAKEFKKANGCRALALEIEHKYQKSGDSYIKCEDYKQALNVFWTGGHYEDIHDLMNMDGTSSLVPRIESKISYAIHLKEIAKVKELLTDVSTYLNTEKFDSQIWSKSMNYLLEIVRDDKNISSLITPKNKDILFKVLEIEESLDISSLTIAHFFYHASDFEKSLNYFRKSENTTDPIFKKARLQHLLERHDSNDKFTKIEINTLGAHFVDSKKYEEAIDLFASENLSSKIKDVLNKGFIREENLDDVLVKYMKVLADKGEWVNLLKYQKGGDFNKDKVNTHIKNKAKFYNALIVREVATSVFLTQADNSTKGVVSEYLNKTFSLKRRKIEIKNEFLTPEVVGAAFERAGKDIDSLKFYEKVIDVTGIFSKDTKKRAKIRWAKVKTKQYKREEKEGKTEQSKNHKNELQQKIDSWNISSVAEEAEYPNITQFLTVEEVKNELPNSETETKEKADFPNFKTTLGDIKISVRRDNGRINIENELTSFQAAISITNRNCKSHDFEFIEEGNRYLGDEHIGVDVIFNEKDSSIVLKISKLGVRFKIA